MDFAQIWFTHRKVIVIVLANVVGLVVVVGGAWALYEATVVPDPPDLITAPVEEVVEFLADEKFDRLSKRKRLDYFRKVVNYNMPADRRRAFVRSLNSMTDMQAEQFKQNFAKVAVYQMTEDAKEYQNLGTKKERQKFLDEKLSDGESLRKLLRGEDLSPGERRGTDVANTRLSRNIPTGSSETYKAFVKSTDSGDRATVETYMSDLQRYAENKKQLAD